MQTVICISIRESMPDQIKVDQKYKLDLSQAYGDRDGTWYAPTYTLNGTKVGDLNLKHFATP